MRIREIEKQSERDKVFFVLDGAYREASHADCVYVCILCLLNKYSLLSLA